MRNNPESEIPRREFIKTLSGCMLALPTLLSATCRSATSEAASPSGRPNVLTIVMDDMNGWLQCLGTHPDVRTPNIDRLAARGVLFTNAHCTAPVCNPSRTSFLAGIRPSTSGVYVNSVAFRRMLPNAVTLPQHFMAGGYRTLGAGKLFHLPDPASWHEFFPNVTNMLPEDPYPPDGNMSGVLVGETNDWGPLDIVDDEMPDARAANWAVGELAKQRDRPFFMGIGLFRPHMPWYLPKRYFDSFPPEKVHLPQIRESDLDDLPSSGRKMAAGKPIFDSIRSLGKWNHAVAGYLASISFADAQVGRILDALDASSYADNTIVVLIGDNGFHLGEKLNWGKWTLWEEATRVPLIIMAPGVTQPGGRCSRSVSLIDLYPTLIDLCGLAPKPELEGMSLSSLLLNPSAVWDRPAICTAGYKNHSVRSEQWRYTRYQDGSEELYNHHEDALEWNNLANDPQYDSIKSSLSAWLPTIDTPPPE